MVDDSKRVSGVQVIARAANILRLLEGESEGLSLGQIAKRVELPRSTVQRIVNALAEEHFLIAATPNARVKLGPAILRMAANTNFDFVKFVRPHLEVLAQSIGETVDLSMNKGDKMVFVDQISANHRLSAISAVGESFSMFNSANGKAALALMDDKMLASLFSAQTAGDAAYESLDLLMHEISQIRENHIALDDEEHTEGVCALGVAFFDPLGRIFAVSVPVPTIRFSKQKDELGKALLVFREDILAALDG